jgi:exonuclease SbcC
VSIRVDSLTIRGLRSAREPVALPLDAPITLVFAANGTGKTTVCEAAELLLTGTVGRLDASAEARWRWLRSDRLPDDLPSEVSAVVRLDDRLETLRTRLVTSGPPDSWVGDRKQTHATLLKLLVPDAAAAGSAGGLAPARLRREWLRSVHFLYDHEVAHLLDQPDTRRTLFADLIGVGPIESQVRVGERWCDELRLRADALTADRLAAEAVARREREALGLLAPHDPAVATARTIALLDRLAAVGAQPPTLTPSAVVALRANAQQRAADARTRASRLSRLGVTLGFAPPPPEALDADAEAADAALTEARATLARRSADVEALTVRQAECDRALHQLATVADLAALGPLASLPPAQWEDHRPEVLWADRSARRAALDAARAEAAQASLHAAEHASLVGRIAAPAPDLAAAEQALAACEAELAATNAAIRATAEPLERLAAAVEAMLPGLHGPDCPACGHGWHDADSLEQALRSHLAPIRAEVADAQARRAAQILQRDRARAALDSARTAQGTRRALQERADALAEALAGWRARAVDLGLTGDAGLTEVDAALAVLDQADAAVARWSALVALGADDRELSPEATVRTLRAHWRAEREATAAKARRAGLAAREAEAAVAQRASRAASVRERVAGQHAQWGALSATWSDLGGDGRPDPATVADARAEAESAAQAWAAVVEAAAKALPVLASAHERSTRGGALAAAEAHVTSLGERQARVEAALAAGRAEVEALVGQRRTETRRVLGGLRHSVDRVFRRLQGNPVVDRVDLSVDALLTVRAGEAELDLARQLSRGQRQDLALALFVARARAHGGTCFLDEPFLHLDDLNRAGTLDLLRTLILQEQGRVRLVVTTASSALVRHLMQKLSRVPWVGDGPMLRVLHLAGGPREGLRVAQVVEL